MPRPNRAHIDVRLQVNSIRARETESPAAMTPNVEYANSPINHSGQKLSDTNQLGPAYIGAVVGEMAQIQLLILEHRSSRYLRKTYRFFPMQWRLDACMTFA